MNAEKLKAMVDKWEPTGCTLVERIDSPMTEEHIVKHIDSDLYSLYRYFELFDGVEVSVDLSEVRAERVMQWLGDRLAA